MVAPCRLAVMEQVRREQIQGTCWREKQPHLLMEQVGNERERGMKLLSHWTERVFIWHVQETMGRTGLWLGSRNRHCIFEISM